MTQARPCWSAQDGRVTELENVFIRGSKIRHVAQLDVCVVHPLTAVASAATSFCLTC